jgi:membrane protease YdiL (CAAX protease family)
VAEIGAEVSARAHLAALRDVLRRYSASLADEIDSTLRGSNQDVEEFLMSAELWGRTGSVVYRAGLGPSREAQRESEDAFLALGEWQVQHGYATREVEDWVFFFRSRRGLSSLPTPNGGAYPIRAVRLRRVAVPWSARDVWLGALAAAVIIGAAWGLLYVMRALSLRPNPDLWVALAPTLFELLLLIPVWWFAVRKHGGSRKSLGFTSFRLETLAIGIGLLVLYLFFNGLYALLLNAFGLQVQPDLTPLAERLATIWPLIVTTVVVAPVVEETFFRAFVFGGLRARYGWRWAAIISAALFAAAHGELTFFIPAFALGCLFAYLYQRSNSIWPGLILHMTVNAIAMIALYVSV